MSAPRITVLLTPAQLEALISAAVYCLAGSPADAGANDDAEGYRWLATLDRAVGALLEVRP